jgi:adenylate cyclase
MNNKIKKILLSPWTALITLALVLSVRVADPQFVESVRLRYFDTLLVNKQPTENNIVTVNIDEATLSKYGQWPFPRDRYAEIIDNLYARNAGLVVWNVLMTEPDRFGKDSVLATVLNTQANVILPNVASTVSKNQPRAPGAAIMNPEYADRIVAYQGIIANIPRLESAAGGVGLTNTLDEIDGVNRRLPLVASVNGKLYPSLAMETLRVAAGDPSFQIKLSEQGVEKLRIPKFGPIATDNLGRIWIDWSQRSKSYSLTELPTDFGGAIVIVGTAAAGLGNPVPTPMGSIWPQDMQAAVIGTMANGVVIQRPDWADGLEIISIALAGVILLFLTRWMYAGLISVVVLVGGSVAASWYGFSHYLWLFDATAFASGTILVALHAYGVKFVSEFLQKQAIKKQFAGYCSPEVVRLLQENPDLIKKGIKKDVSVMFSDLRGFTPIGEYFDRPGNGGPEGLAKYMNGYMDAITIPIIEANGMVLKYVGDASMHIHGAPLDDPNHARTIVAVGLEMLDRVQAFTKEKEAQGLPPAAMGWGCNTGDGYIGEMGSTARHGYDILGDMVSTAARLEARCKAYGVLCIIGAETYNRTKNDFFYLLLDNLQPKGKTVADLIYTALRVKGDIVKYESARSTHNKMHELYKAKEFKAAQILCDELKGSFDGQMDKYYSMWIERCDFMAQQNLGDDWRGEFIAHEK